MLSCPRCLISLPDESSLYTHLKINHRLSDVDIHRIIGGQGWHEPEKKTIMDEDGMRKVSPEHRNAWMRSQPKPLTVPIVPVPQKKELQIPQGWNQIGQNEYSFEREVYHYKDSEKSVRKVLESNLNSRYGVARLKTIYRDCSEYADACEKKNVLAGRLSGFVPSDPSFVSVASELHNSIYKANEIKKSLKDDISVETLMEETSRYSSDIPENTTWMESFLKRVTEEGERLSKSSKEPPNK